MAEALELTQGPAGDGLPVPFPEVPVAQVGEGFPGLDDLVEDHDDGVGHRHRRPVGSDQPGQAVVPDPQEGLGPGCGLGRLHQSLPS